MASETAKADQVYGRITERDWRSWSAGSVSSIRSRIRSSAIVNDDSIRHAARADRRREPALDRRGACGALALSGRRWRRRRSCTASPGAAGTCAAAKGCLACTDCIRRDRWTYYRPILAGDEIRATKKLVALEEKTGSYAGRSIIQTREFTYPQPARRARRPLPDVGVPDRARERQGGRQVLAHRGGALHRRGDRRDRRIDGRRAGPRRRPALLGGRRASATSSSRSFAGRSPSPT